MIDGQTTTYTSNGATGYTITIPNNDDAYAMTRLIGTQYDIALNASIVNPQAMYPIGSTMQVKYRLENI